MNGASNGVRDAGFGRWASSLVGTGSTGARRFVGNSTAVLLLGAATRVSAFAAFILLSHALQPAQLGVFALILATIEVTRHLTDLGFGTATVRRLAATGRSEWARTLSTALVIRMLTACAGFVGLFLISTLPAFEPHSRLLIVGALSLFTAAAVAALTTPFQASLEMPKLFGVHLASAVVYLSLVAWGATHGWSLLAFFGSLLVQEILTLSGVWILFSRRYRMTRPRLSEVKPLVGDGLRVGLLSLIVMLYFRLDIFMLEALRGNEAVGQYALAFRISEAFLLGAIALSTSAFPRLVALSGDPSRARLADNFKALYLSAAIMGLSAAVFVSLFAGSLVGALLPGYGEAARLATLLIWSVAFMFVNIQTADVLIALGHTGAVTRIASINLAINAALNLLLIPRYGAMGAVIATVATEGLNSLMQGWYLSARIGIPVPIRAWAVALASIAGAVAWEPLLGAALLVTGLTVFAANRILANRVERAFT